MSSRSTPSTTAFADPIARFGQATRRGGQPFTPAFADSRMLLREDAAPTYLGGRYSAAASSGGTAM